MLLAIVGNTQGEATRVAYIKFYAIVAPVLRLFVQLPATCHMPHATMADLWRHGVNKTG